MGVIYFNESCNQQIHPFFVGGFTIGDNTWSNAIEYYKFVRDQPCYTFSCGYLNEKEQRDKSFHALHEGIIRALCTNQRGIDALINTHPKVLVYDTRASKGSAELGCGLHGDGPNILGIALMRIRHAFIEYLDVPVHLLPPAQSNTRFPPWKSVSTYQCAMNNFPTVSLGGRYELIQLIERLLDLRQMPVLENRDVVSHPLSDNTPASSSDTYNGQNGATVRDDRAQPLHFAGNLEVLDPIGEQPTSCARRILRRCFRV